MVFQNKEKKNIPVLQVLRKEYSLFNIFLVVFSMLFMGLCRTLEQHFFNINTRLKNTFYYFFIIFFCFFMYGIFYFIKKIIKEIYLVSWPSYGKIFLKVIQVFCFTLVLEFFIYFFSFLYEKIDPLL
ncbi:preprotein translocase, SecE subunit [Candidatus Phytoplasma oryzae]|uniref:Preprotein translocase, SecE subunit n=1 Tax=Candidatus Phytoplasma oryzae TaxID=203274 RepID=A0A139JQA5_9MOLU|nr:preprotein translocase subunit SecE [Candidatus Phytoplasma oryzae]KXT29044.1 preprotein translocase, SecE subunit [Candidatus Phytoplasma oryzae]RAM57804.1 hypothetical protein DH96_01750 [Candidatus Phytoplasma oryzae]